MKAELATLERQAARLLAELKDSGGAILITEHGTPSAHLVDVELYEGMQSKVRILEGIVRGERALIENRTLSDFEAKQTMAKWLG